MTQVLTKKQIKRVQKIKRIHEMVDEIKSANNGIMPLGSRLAIAEQLRLSQPYVSKVITDYERKS